MSWEISVSGFAGARFACRATGPARGLRAVIATFAVSLADFAKRSIRFTASERSEDLVIAQPPESPWTRAPTVGGIACEELAASGGGLTERSRNGSHPAQAALHQAACHSRPARHRVKHVGTRPVRKG